MSEEAMEAQLLYASLRSPNKSLYALNAENAKLLPKGDEEMVKQWFGDEQKMSRGDELTSHMEYTIRGKKKDFYVIFFGNSVVHPTVRVTASKEIEIFASKADQINGNEYIYKKVFLTGDHIQIRWRPRKSEALEPSTHSQSIPLP